METWGAGSRDTEHWETAPNPAAPGLSFPGVGERRLTTHWEEGSR